MSPPLVRFIIWLISIHIALFIGVMVGGLIVSMPTQYFWNRDMATEWFLFGWPLAIVAGYWTGTRSYRFVKRRLSSKWISESAATEHNPPRHTMTKSQRRLVVLSGALVLLLGPIVLMGNCSGWNEGSMKVAACTVDFPLARDLANMLYGVVLFSAFLLGIPILFYLAACVFLIRKLDRYLRENYPEELPSGSDASTTAPRRLS